MRALLLSSLLIGCVATPAAPEPIGRSSAALSNWFPGGAMSVTRVFHSATALTDGRVLVVGGDGDGTGVYATSEIYAPTTKTFSAGPSMASPRASHTATRLADGRVLVIGGRTTDDGSTALGTAEVFDPKTNAWTAAGTMAHRRTDHTATLLPSGKVLVVGGTDGSDFHAEAELWDPATKTFAIAGALENGRILHTASLLGSKVVVAAGYDSDALSTTAIYDTTSGAWTAGPNLVATHSEHTAVALDVNRLLILGGFSDPTTFSNVAEVLDLGTGKATRVGDLESPRANGQSILLTNGQALAVCGRDSGGAVGRAELYDVASQRWSSAGPLTGKRDRCAVAPLPDGKVLVVGGVGGVGYYSDAEIYAPAGSAAVCTANGDCASGHCVDGVCCNTSCSGSCERCDADGSIGTCKAISGAKNHCAAGEICVDAACVKGAGTRCSADGLSSIDNAEKSSSCGAYRCRATDGACFPSCTDSSQCAPGFACDGSKCTTSSTDDSGGCTTPRGPSSGHVSSWIAGALTLIGLSRLSRRRR